MILIRTTTYTFHGLAGEDPHKHLKELHVVCTSMKPTGVTEDQIKLRAFPFSLNDSTKDWLYYLPSRSIKTWNEMKRLFGEIFPSFKGGQHSKRNLWSKAAQWRVPT